MIRTYKRKIGSGKYRDVPRETTEKAEKEVEDGKSIQETSNYNVPYNTLWNKVKKGMKAIGVIQLY